MIHEESRASDAHGPLISSIRAGLEQGVQAKHVAGVINDTYRDEILEVIRQAREIDFKPILYVMAYSDVEKLVKPVPVAQRAHPLSEEFIIEELPGGTFDILDLDDL